MPKLTTAAVLAVVGLLVLAGTATPTVASFGDTEAISATFETGAEQPLTTQSVGLNVTTQDGQDDSTWARAFAYSPSDYPARILVITGDDRVLRLEIESESPDPVTFSIHAATLAEELGVPNLRGISGTLDGQTLQLRTVGSDDSERVEFTVDHFSTRYVVLTVPERPPGPPTDTGTGTDTDSGQGKGQGNSNGNGNR